MRWLKRGLIGLGLLVGAFWVGLVLLVVVGVAHTYAIPSSSMEPTLHCARPAVGCEGAHDDRILTVAYTGWSPARGDVVAFHTSRIAEERCGALGVFIKRVVGLPGDTVDEDGSGFLWITSRGSTVRRRFHDPYVRGQARAEDAFKNREWRVPAGRYFMVGDNRGESCDSREWGSLARSSMIGRAVATYWPLSRIALY